MSHPPNWEKIKFEKIVKNVTDRIDKPSESGLKHYVGLEHLDTDSIKIKNYGTPDQVNATKYLAKKGDIIFGKRRAYLRKVAITEHEAVVSAHSMIFRPKVEVINPRCLPFLLQSSTFWRMALSISEGSLSPTIKWKTIAKQELYIPDFSEQEKIANLLWSIEEHITRTERLLSILYKLKKGFLNKFIFEDEDIQRINFSNESYFKVLGSGINKFDSTKDYLSTSSINGGSINFVEEKITYTNRPSRANMQPLNNSVWFARMKETSKYYMFINETDEINRYILSTGFAGILCLTDTVLPEFLFELISSDRFQKMKDLNCQGGVQPAINNTSLKKMNIPIPSVDVQKKLMMILNLLNNQHKCLNNDLIELTKFKKRLNDGIFKGEVKV